MPQETLLWRLFPLCDFFARLQRGMLFLRADPTRVPQETLLRRLFLLCDFFAEGLSLYTLDAAVISAYAVSPVRFREGLPFASPLGATR